MDYIKILIVFFDYNKKKRLKTKINQVKISFWTIILSFLSILSVPAAHMEGSNQLGNILMRSSSLAVHIL